MRDLRNVGSRGKYSDICWLYPTEAVDGNTLKLKEDAVAICRFYKGDIEAFRWERVEINGGMFSTNRQYRGVVESLDDLSMMRPDMYVEDESGMIYIVEDNIVVDDDAMSKTTSLRPKTKYKFGLRALE